MFRVLFVVFLLVPLIEIFILIKVGGAIGALPTVALVVFTAVLGAVIIRLQGMLVFWRFQEKLRTGEMPAEEMMTGAALLLAGALLLTPGFFTDTVGFLLLVPPVRRWVFGRLVRHMTGPGGPGPGRHTRVTLEGDYHRED